MNLIYAIRALIFALAYCGWLIGRFVVGVAVTWFRMIFSGGMNGRHR